MRQARMLLVLSLLIAACTTTPKHLVSPTPTPSPLSPTIPFFFLPKDPTTPSMNQGRLLMWDPSTGTVQASATVLFRMTWPRRGLTGEELNEQWRWDGRTLVEIIEFEPDAWSTPPVPSISTNPESIPVRTVVLTLPAFGIYDGRWFAHMEERGSDPPVLVVEDRDGGTGTRRAQAPKEFGGTSGWQPLLVSRQTGGVQVVVQYQHETALGSGEMVCSLVLAMLQGRTANWKKIEGDGVCDLQNPQAVRIRDQIYVTGGDGPGNVTGLNLASDRLSGSLTYQDFLRFEGQRGIISDPTLESRIYYTGLGAWGDLLLVAYALTETESVIRALRDGKPTAALLIDTAQGRIRSVGGSHPTDLRSVRLLLTGYGPVLPLAGEE